MGRTRGKRGADLGLWQLRSVGWKCVWNLAGVQEQEWSGGVPEEHGLSRGSWDRNSDRLSGEGNVRVKQGLGRRAQSSCGRSGEAQSGPEATGLKDEDLSFPLGREENESTGASLVWLPISRENHTGSEEDHPGFASGRL